MIERKIIQDRTNEFSVDQFIRHTISDVPIKSIALDKTPLGERVTIFTSAPGLVIGREGANIKKLTVQLRDQFGFENPQVKIGEVQQPNLSAAIVAKTIANNLSNFGSQRFKLTGFKALSSVMDAGAMGVEIRITGKLPSSRAKSWRFQKGYLKKTGYVSDFIVDKAIDHVTLKTGVVGIKVEIMLPDTPLPDKIIYHDFSTPKAGEEQAVEEKINKVEEPSNSKKENENKPAATKVEKEVVEE